MAREQIFDELKNIIGGYVEVDDNFNEDFSLNGDIGLDSFGLISMVCAIEDNFNIRIPEYEMTNFLTIHDIVGYIEHNVA